MVNFNSKLLNYQRVYETTKTGQSWKKSSSPYRCPVWVMVPFRLRIAMA